MDDFELRWALDTLLAVDLEHADHDWLSDVVSMSSQLQGFLNSFDIKCARRTRQLAEVGRSEPADSMLGNKGRRSDKDAKKIADRADLGESMSDLEDALGAGTVSTGHLDAIASATKGLDEDLKAQFFEHEEELLEMAETESVDAFTRRCRQLARRLVAASSKSDAEELDNQRKRSRVKRWVDQITGMHHTHLELDPIRDAKLWSVLDAQLATLRQADGNAKTPWSQLQVEAIIAAVEAGVTNGDGSDRDPGAKNSDAGRRIPEVTVLVDWETLLAGLHHNGICETEDGVPLPGSTVRRLCCEAEVLPAVLGDDGEILDVGRSARTATKKQRSALRAMYRTCAHPDCTVKFSACRIHHIKWWWEHRGRTDMDNLLPLCERHHHLVHEGGWGLTMTPDRATIWSRPDGVTAYTGTSTNRAPNGVSSPAPSDDREFASI